MTIRSAYGPHDPLKYTAPHSDEMITKQAFKDSCDINQILIKYQKSGVIEHVAKHHASYRDLDGATFTENMQQIAKAQTMFNELPSKARAHFENDPAKFLEYVNDLDIEGQREELIEMGLMEDIPMGKIKAQIDKNSEPQTPVPEPSPDEPA